MINRGIGVVPMMLSFCIFSSSQIICFFYVFIVIKIIFISNTYIKYNPILDRHITFYI